jgi:hypothetical protein
MHLEAEATLTQERLRKFAHWNYYRKDYSKKIVLLLVFLVTLNSWVTYVIQGTWNLFILALLVLLVVLLGLLTAYPTWTSAAQFRRRPASRLTERFVFEDDGFEVVNDGDPNLVEHASVKYEGLFLVVEEPDLFYFFTEKSRAYIVWKYDFAEGDTDELGRTLADLLGPKYLWDK